MAHWLLSFVALISLLSPHLCSPIQNDNQEKNQVSDEVKELESLRTESAKPNSSDALQKETVDGQAAVLEPLPTPVPVHAEGHPSSKSAIFRHRGITQAKRNMHWNERVQQPSEGYMKFPGIQYSPADLALYVFNTGDEEGVAVAVEELVREGMMGRTDAINYLQDVKQILNYMREMREQFQPKKQEEFDSVSYPKPRLSQHLPNLPREQFISALSTADKRRYIQQPDSVESAPSSAPPPVRTTEPPKQVEVASTTELKESTDSASTTASPKTEITAPVELKEEESKRRLTQKNGYEFTLEVIYKLAKDMFTQSLLRDDPTAEETLSGLVSFLESEVGNQHISPKMKEKVLEVVSSALVDSLREYQTYVSDNQAFDEQGTHRRFPESNGYIKVPVSEIYRNLAGDGHESMLQLSQKNKRPKAS